MDYILEKANEIAKTMLTRNYDDYRVSTCDHSNWDRKLHRFFPYIADRLRAMGFKVNRSNKWGVTDWDILIVGPIKFDPINPMQE